ncbi:hypothetical protein AVEN_222934-1, partial [Araneus ventricosus]
WYPLKGKSEKSEEKERGEIEVRIAFIVQRCNDTQSLNDLSFKKKKHSIKHLAASVEVICECWGSTIDEIVQKRPTAIDGDDAAVGTTDKRMFIYSIGAAPPGHKSVRKLLKAAIVAMYGPNFHKHFVNSTSPLMSRYLTSKVIHRIANSECMPLF